MTDHLTAFTEAVELLDCVAEHLEMTDDKDDAIVAAEIRELLARFDADAQLWNVTA